MALEPLLRFFGEATCDFGKTHDKGERSFAVKRTFVVLFEENSAADPSIRDRVFPEHISYLAKNFSSVTAAGTVFYETGKRFGGMWIVQAAERREVDTLVTEDPFWPTGLRKRYEILEWRIVFNNGEKLK